MPTKRSSVARHRPNRVATGPKLALWLRNEAGRRGVPVRASFEHWIGAALTGQRQRLAVNLLIVGTRRGRAFNRDFRGRDHATNVLSFPYEPLPHEKSDLLGDLVICAPVVVREAREQRKPLRAHYAHLVVHGTLHLLGHDHERDADAERMETLETRILARLGIPNPYVDRSSA